MKRAVTLASVLIAALTLAGCQHKYPHACDNHGGIHSVIKGIYYCNDGTSIGGGWLWLHHETVAP